LRHLPLSQGALFAHDRVLHARAEFGDPRRRIVALFCYDRDPGMVFDQGYIDELHDSMPG
jgi:hypothetical protein